MSASTAAYLRVSTAAQSTGMQREAIERACSARGLALPGAWYVESITGRHMQRPELTRLRAAIRAGEVRTLVVWRLDRLTRSGIRDTLDVVHELERHGCELVTVADGFDVAGPARDVVLSVLAWAAQMEREAIGERIRAARTSVAERGGTWGRPKRMDRADRAKAEALAAQGRTVRQIAAMMRVPKSTIQRELAASRTAAAR